MMKYLYVSLILFLVCNSTLAQVSNLGVPVLFKEKLVKTKSFFQTPAVDNLREIEAEKERSLLSKDKVFHFGKEHTVSIDVFAAAEKTILPNGNLLYQFGIECKNAVSINLMFDKFELAQGVCLYFVDMEHKKFDGAYTSLNNNASKMLGTELIYTQKGIIEVLVPQGKEGLSTLHLGTIIHGYRNLNEMVKSLNSSGSCEIDVNCPLGAGWQNQRNSVAMMINGGGFCTGSLVNNTSGTIIPYFLSANHCGTTPGSWVFRFRWESPEGSADCATSAPSIDGPTTMNINGATLCAANATSDFTLSLLNTAPDPAWGIYYNGWDRTDIPATQCTGIHHPAGDIKKISRDDSQALSSEFGGGTSNSHWRVPSWDQGVTEGGSSGSPLFNQNHRTIGQLHGGASSCGAIAANMNDDYGKFFLSWTGGATNSTRLSNWLDPSNIGSMFIDGVDPAASTFVADGAVSNARINFETVCGGNLTPQIDIYNSGSSPITSATINYGFDGLTNLTYNYVGTLNAFETQTIILPVESSLLNGNHSFKAIFVNTTATDENALNDTTTAIFTTIVGGEIISLELTINCYANENSWEITDTLSTIVFASGGSYDDTTPIPIIDSVCLEEKCYYFKLYDSYGDGLEGATSPVCANGEFSLYRSNGALISQLLPVDANFGNLSLTKFCLGNIGIDEKIADNAIQMFPNPASTNLTILSGFKMDKIEIKNLTGQKVFENKTAIDTISIDISSFSKGMYLVEIYSEKGFAVKQLIVQ